MCLCRCLHPRGVWAHGTGLQQEHVHAPRPGNGTNPRRARQGKSVNTNPQTLACVRKTQFVQALPRSPTAYAPRSLRRFAITPLHPAQVGRQLATLSVEFRRKSTGQVVATATHTKFLGVADPTSTVWAQPAQRSKL